MLQNRASLRTQGSNALKTKRLNLFGWPLVIPERGSEATIEWVNNFNGTLQAIRLTGEQWKSSSHLHSTVNVRARHFTKRTGPHAALPLERRRFRRNSALPVTVHKIYTTLSRAKVSLNHAKSNHRAKTVYILLFRQNVASREVDSAFITLRRQPSQVVST